MDFWSLLFCGLLYAFVSPCFSLPPTHCPMVYKNLDNGDLEISYEIPPRRKPFERQPGANCDWKFKPQTPGGTIALSFVSMSFNGKCKDGNFQISLGEAKMVVCSMRESKGVEGVTGDSLSLSIRARHGPANFTAIVKEITKYSENCEFISPVRKTGIVVFRPAAIWDLPLKLQLETETDYDEMESKISKLKYNVEMIDPNGMGTTFCKSLAIQVPQTEIPSCHTFVDFNCEWRIKSGLISATNDPELTVRHWKVIDEESALVESDKPSEVDKVCLHVQYKSNSSDSSIKLTASKSDKESPLVEMKLQADGNWNMVKLVAPLPSEMSFSRLLLSFDKAQGTAINKIYGCDAGRNEDRVLMEQDVEELPTPECNHTPRERRPEEKCRNGGVLKGESCLCPIGFSGRDCEIGCGNNRWGPDCKIKCSASNLGCRFMIFWNYTHVSCPSGYHGRYCHKRCEAGRYGSGCKEECGRCLEGSCDPFTGYCRSGCYPGFTPPLCQHGFLRLLQGPEVTDIAYDSVIVQAALSNDSVVGEGIPVFYRLEYKGLSTPAEASEWRGGRLKRLGQSGRLKEKISGLRAGTLYTVRIILYDRQAEPRMPSPNTPQTNFTTACTVTNSLQIDNVHFMEDEVAIQWMDESKDDLRCALKEVEVDLRTEFSDWETYVVQNVNYKVFFPTLPGVRYMSRVRPKGGQYSRIYYFKTESKEDGRVSNLRMNWVGTNSAELAWDILDTDLDPKFMIDFECLEDLTGLEDEDCKEDIAFSVTTQTPYNLTGLQPYKHYLVRVQHLGGSNYSEISIVTKPILSKIPQKVHLDTMEQPLVQWWYGRLPDDTFHIFTIQVNQTDAADPSECCTNFTMHVPYVEGKETYSVPMTGLKPASRYVVGVAAGEEAEAEDHWGRGQGVTAPPSTAWFPPARLQLNSSPPLTWIQPQASLSPVNYSPIVQRVILVAVEAENEDEVGASKAAQTAVESMNIDVRMGDGNGTESNLTNAYIIGSYQLGENMVVDSTLENKAYRLVVVYELNYYDHRSFPTVVSSIFTVNTNAVTSTPNSNITPSGSFVPV